MALPPQARTTTDRSGWAAMYLVAIVGRAYMRLAKVHDAP